MLKTKEKIIAWLERYGIKNYTINADLTVDVDENVNLSNKNLKSIDVQFYNVLGDFNCSENKLTSLNGSPQYVLGNFNFNCNKLKNFKYGPKEVGKNFYCEMNNINNLDYLPAHLGRDLYLFNNEKLGKIQLMHNIDDVKKLWKIIKHKESLDTILKSSKRNNKSTNKI